MKCEMCGCSDTKKNPYPKFLTEWCRHRKIKNDSHTKWQEGYDAKEKEAQDLYEALKTALGTILALDNGKSWLNEIYPTINKAIAKWEDKGNWYLEEETGLILSIPDGADSPVSVASVGGNQEPLTAKPLSETEANAHLISQAPKLYEALKALTKRINDMKAKGYLKVSTGMPMFIAEQAIAEVEK